MLDYAVRKKVSRVALLIEAPPADGAQCGISPGQEVAIEGLAALHDDDGRFFGAGSGRVFQTIDQMRSGVA